MEVQIRQLAQRHQPHRKGLQRLHRQLQGTLERGERVRRHLQNQDAIGAGPGAVERERFRLEASKDVQQNSPRPLTEGGKAEEFPTNDHRNPD